MSHCRAPRPVLAAATALALVSISGAALPALSRPADSIDRSDTSVEGVFSDDSPFYRELPDDTPVADDSEILVSSLYQQGIDNYGQPDSPSLTINVYHWTAPLFAASTTDVQHDIRPWNCQNKDPGWDAELAGMLRGVHLPAAFEPDDTTDGNVSIYNVDTGQLVELWQARQAPDGAWEACWGGMIEDASRSQGSFPVPYGAAAGGLAMWGYTIRQQELLDGSINHVVGLGIPKVKRGVISWPAVRTDGREDGTELAMGQMLRLPADFDLDSLNLSPSARTVAQAAQDYGIIITDTSGALAFAGEHASGLLDVRYEEIFRGRYSVEEMAGDPARGEDPFPLDQLVALPVDYGQDLPWPPEEPIAVDPESDPDADRDEVTSAGEDVSPTTAAASPETTAAAPPETTSEAEEQEAAIPWAAVLVGLLVAAGAAVAGLLLRRR
ncbi:hypothetical protein [Ornithinimicrobium pratense]|uniref:Uncharacterized protein n=1 Tax=Ornithinimicrobium pratense TaxID=2593973 RepID=A0A5J6V9D6_9MICO|nr:hypothetical protein [Ornithinimicrobium pratense]QFG69771.1 hypothetical protein FY030_14650 [Ornithinimicrobium pratense]